MTRLLALTLLLFIVSVCCGNTTLHAQDEAAAIIEQLRTQAEKLEEHALNTIRSGAKNTDLPPEVAIEMARAHRREAELRQQMLHLNRDADELALQRKFDESAELRRKAKSVAAMVDQLHARREIHTRTRHEKQQLRDKLLHDAERANPFRREGDDEEEDAAALEARIRERVRAAGLDRAQQRANELQERAIKAKLDGRHEDAKLFAREAQRLQHDIQAQTHATQAHGEKSHAYGDHEHGPSGEALRTSEVQQLRAEVRELAEHVKNLQHALQAMQKQLAKQQR